MIVCEVADYVKYSSVCQWECSCMYLKSDSCSATLSLEQCMFVVNFFSSPLPGPAHAPLICSSLGVKSESFQAQVIPTGLSCFPGILECCNTQIFDSMLNFMNGSRVEKVNDTSLFSEMRNYKSCV